MTIEKPRTPTSQEALKKEILKMLPLGPIVQKTIIWVDSASWPIIYGDKSAVSITFGAGHEAWNIYLDPSVYRALKEAIARSEEKRKDLPESTEWVKVRLYPRWQFWRRWTTKRATND